MSLFLGLDAVAAPRGDGLRPELRRLMIRHAQATGNETWNCDRLSTDSMPTGAPDFIEPQHIPVSGL